MSIEWKQDGEDWIWVARDRSYAGKIVEVLRLNGTTGKVQATGGIATGATALDIEWDKAAADGAAATATTEHSVFRAPGPCLVKSVEFVPDVAATANDTNYFSIIVQRRNADGTNAVVVAQINATVTVAPFSGNWVQWQAVKFALTAANLALTAGQILTVQITKTGTGLVCPAGQLMIEYALA